MQGDPKQHPLEEIIDDYLHARVSRRGFLKRAGALGIGALTAGSILAACGGESTDEASPVATTEPVSGGTFREGYDRDFSPLDPVYSNWDDPGMNAVYEAVAIRDPQGTLVPMLCDSFESTATGWTFQLRDGLKFHSGAALTAGNCRRRLQRVQGPAGRTERGLLDSYQVGEGRWADHDVCDRWPLPGVPGDSLRRDQLHPEPEGAS